MAILYMLLIWTGGLIIVLSRDIYVKEGLTIFRLLTRKRDITGRQVRCRLQYLCYSYNGICVYFH